MKKQLLILVLSFAAFSCNTNSDSDISPANIIGFWNRETVYLNGVNSIEYVDFLNGNNFMNISKDKTFERAYEFGSWSLSNKTLTLKRDANSGMQDWTYTIIEHTEGTLILEMKLTEGKYCCNFDSFNDSEVITIREVYKRTN